MMDMSFLTKEEVEELMGPTPCKECGKPISDCAVIDAADGNPVCFDCLSVVEGRILRKAEKFARKHVEITQEFPKFYPRYKFSCTPEEYELGDRESYTEDSYRCHLRHNCTNYDDLIKKLDRDNLRDSIFYNAIRERVEEMIEAEIEANDLIRGMDEEMDDEYEEFDEE